MVVIQASYKEGEYKFYFLREKSVYFNIRGEVSVIQTSLKKGECNLLNNKFVVVSHKVTCGTAN